MPRKNNNKNARERVSIRKFLSKTALMAATGIVASGCATQQTNPYRLLQKLEERDQKIAERDKVIDELMARVQQLENRFTVASAAGQPANVPVAAANQGLSKGSSSAGQRQAQAQTVAKAGPGSFEVDEDAAQRALERTLVQTGALLLPVGLAEIQPFVTYTRRESKDPILLSANNALRVSNAEIRRNEFDMGANLLVGLPFESQAEFRVPYKSVNQSVVVPNGVNSQEFDNTGDSIGDISVGLAKTLYHESEWLPDLIGRITWDSASGSQSNNNVALGDGFNDFTASLTALKRQDPLAFTGRIAYQTFLKENGIDPGDQASLSLGVTLAASPQTSLSFGLQQTYAQETEVNNVKIPGSDTVSSAFTLGAASTIGHHLFISAVGGIGLTDSSPEYFFNFTLPYRFDVPFKFLGTNRSK
jgi:cell division protein FtsL